jgi:hypothetical protein
MSATDDLISVHLEPAWRDRADFIVMAELPEEGRLEQLWARQVSEHSFEICCIPFFVYDLALGDVVDTAPRSGRRYVLSEVIARSGRYVFRVHFDLSMSGSRERVERDLKALGALTEWSSLSLLAVDVAEEDHAQRIAHFLLGEEKNGRLVYETGKSS